MDSLDSTTGIVALAAAGIALLALLAALTLALKLRRLRADQRLVLGAAGERDLIEHAAEAARQVQDLRSGVEELSGSLFDRIEEVEQRLDGAIARTAVVRYDAFNETSGRQSSSVALLDDTGSGVVLSAIHQREQARVYAKPVIAGDSPLDLSPEEREALRRAQQGSGTLAGGERG